MSQLVDLDALEDVLAGQWPRRLARCLYQASALRHEYMRGRRDEEFESYDYGDDEQDEGCIGSECCCPHIFHTSAECFTADMARAYEEEMSQ